MDMKMTTQEAPQYIAFQGDRNVATGALEDVAVTLKMIEEPMNGCILIFHSVTSERIELDLRGSLEDVRAWAARHIDEEGESSAQEKARAELKTDKPASRGRPKIGVVSREVTLLPRHWQWLKTQRGGASAALRRLVDRARRQEGGEAGSEQIKNAVHRFMNTIAGDRPGYEDALRALYAEDKRSFENNIQHWPVDIKAHCLTLVEPLFPLER